MCGGSGKTKKRDAERSGSKTYSVISGENISIDSVNTSAIPHTKKISELTTIFQYAGDKLVVLEFYAPWCGPCKKLAPILEAWVDTYPDVLLVKSNVDKAQSQLIERYNISTIPTFVFVRKGKVLHQFTEGKYPQLKELIETHRIIPNSVKTSVTTTTLVREGIKSEKLDNKPKLSNQSDKQKTDKKGSTESDKPKNDKKGSTESDNQKGTEGQQDQGRKGTGSSDKNQSKKDSGASKGDDGPNSRKTSDEPKKSNDEPNDKKLSDISKKSN